MSSRATAPSLTMQALNSASQGHEDLLWLPADEVCNLGTWEPSQVKGRVLRAIVGHLCSAVMAHERASTACEQDGAGGIAASMESIHFASDCEG